MQVSIPKLLRCFLGSLHMPVFIGTGRKPRTIFVAYFGVRVPVLFHLMFVHNTLTSVLVAWWPPFGETASHSIDHLFSLPLSICIFTYFCFKSEIWLLIAPVSVYCFSITLCLAIIFLTYLLQTGMG